MAGAQKVSQFPAATSVATTDEVPILQGGVTKRVTVAKLTGAPDFGYQATGESWTFASFNSTTRIGVVNVPSDATTKYSIGMWVRFAQTTGGTKWAIITAVTTSTLTLNMFYNQSLTNEAITTPVYSSLAQPYGAPKLPVRSTDAAGWRVHDFGTYKEWTKSFSKVININGSTWMHLSGEALPTGLSSIGTRNVTAASHCGDAAITTNVGASPSYTTIGNQITNQFSGAVNGATIVFNVRIFEEQ